MSVTDFERRAWITHFLANPNGPHLKGYLAQEHHDDSSRAMRMAVFTATVIGTPTPAAELATVGWTTGHDEYQPLLAPAVRNHVVPRLAAAGLL